MNNSSIFSTRDGIVPLDMYSCCGIIVITIGMPILGDRGAREKRQPASEGPCPPRRGQRGPHKLQGAVLEFIQRHLVAGKPIRARELAKLVRQEFGLNVHPRTIERAVAVKKTPR